MEALLAAAPPAVAALLLLVGVAPLRAGLLASLTGVLVLAVAFPVGSARLLEAQAEALAIGVEVVLIILGGVLLYEVLAFTGAADRIGEWAADVSEDPALRVLFVVLGLTPFVESVTGFGVGVTVAAPLLLRMGYAPVPAAVLALFGLVAVPWGALAPGTLVGARLGGVGFTELGVSSALLSLPVFVVVGVAALVVAVGPRGALRGLPSLAVVALALWAGILGANVAVGTPLAGALGSLLGVGAALLLVRVRERRRVRLPRDVRRALAPYGLLLALLLLSRVVAAAMGAAPGEPGAGLAATVLVSPVLWLLVTCALTLAWAKAGAQAAPVVRRALGRWQPVALTTLVFLALGALMTASGMATALAEAGARLGRGYLALAPWVGGLGGFLTGSNAGANAMFVAAQGDAAARLDVSREGVLAVQNVSASLLTMASAPRVALAVTLLGLGESDARVTRTVLLVDAVVLAVLGLVAVALLG